MSKELFLSRYALIVKRLEKSPATFQELSSYLEHQSEIHGYNYNISIRTFQRDIKDIERQLGIIIENDRKGDRKYLIVEKEEEKVLSQRLLENYQIINAIQSAKEHNNYVFPEHRQPIGLDNFQPILFAITNKRILQFSHFKYWEDKVTIRTVHPLGLKESQGRWYLMAVDTKDNAFKTFGLDRISDLDIQKRTFKTKYTYNLKTLYQNCFGIMGTDETPEKVQLKFNAEQGHYIKGLPLHHSQNIIKEDSNEIIVELYITVTHDFVMHLLSYGPNMQVIYPKKLIKILKEKLTKTLEQY